MNTPRFAHLDTPPSGTVATQTPPAPVSTHGFVCVPGFIASPLSAYLPCISGQIVSSQDILRMAHEAALKSVRRSWYPMGFSNN